MHPELLCCKADAGAQFFQGERLSKEFQHFPAEGADQVEFAEFPLEQALFERSVGQARWLKAVTGRRIDYHAPIGVCHTGAKGSGGHMPFPRGSKAQNETLRPGRQMGLVRVWHDGGIEQRGSFEGILVSEIPTDQWRSFFGDCQIAQQLGARLLESTPEKLPDILVASPEFGPQLPEQFIDFSFGEGHDAGANLAGALATHEMKRPDQDTLAVGIQSDFRAIDVDRVHRCLRCRLVEYSDGILHELHFRKREQESQR